MQPRTTGQGLARRLLRLAVTLLIIGGVTLLYYRFVSVNSTTVALTLLLTVLGVATAWGLLEAVVASVAGMLCFNYFFLPPVGTFTIADPQNWVALLAFLVTSVVASQLSAGVKRRAVEAMRRQHEMERLYALSRNLMLLDDRSPVTGQVCYHIAQVFDLPGAAFFDRGEDHVFRAGAKEVPISESKLRDAAIQGTAFHDPAAGISVLPVNLGAGPIGSLAIYGGTVSEAALHAIANLAAVAVERARAQETASRAEAARQHEKLKSTLLDALAHEFTTPLTSIKAAASAIVDEDRVAQKELGAVIEEEADRLNSLVSETVQMARIEAGDLRLYEQRQSVAALIASALDRLKVFLEDREVRVEVAEHLPEVAVDAELIGLTIRQLVSNALKYSNPEAPITVEAHGEPAGVTISVKDYGPGIPERELTRIFDRFYRVPDSAPVPGIGLGLAIAREIVEAHGGKIWAESKPRQGSQFFLTLPRAREEGAS